MKPDKLRSRQIVKTYWTGGINRGINMTIVKEKKIDIITNNTNNHYDNAQEAKVLEKN